MRRRRHLQLVLRFVFILALWVVTVDVLTTIHEIVEAMGL
jgi:hypothetical protein